MPAQEMAKKALDAFNRHDAGAFAALYAADAVAPDPQYAEPLQGREAIRKDIEDFCQALPDVQARVIGDFLVNGDTVAFEAEITGTHKGAPCYSGWPSSRHQPAPADDRWQVCTGR